MNAARRLLLSVLCSLLSALLLGCAAPIGPIVNHADALDLPPLPTAFRSLAGADVAPDEIEIPPPAWKWIEVSWDAYPPPTSFTIYAAPTPSGPWQRLTNTTATVIRFPLDRPARYFKVLK